MVVQVNKRSVLLVLLVLLALLLVSQNLRQAQQLAAAHERRQGHQLQAESLTLRDIAAAASPSTEEPRWLSERSQELQALLKCRNRRLRLQRLQHGSYWVIQNLVMGRESRRMGCAESITYTTNGDYTFFDNLETVTERWLGPISFAIHTPGYDLNATLDAIQYVRNCLPGSQLISDFVSFHIYFSNEHMPEYVPRDENDALNWPFRCVDEEGNMLPPPYAAQNRTAMYKVQANLTYPINVGRNIARGAVNTHFIFACDIELYPSLGLVDQFLDMVQRNNSVLAMSPGQKPRVYPLPVFELKDGERVPNDKAELLPLLEKGRAQLFHAKVCTSCHKVPGYKDWINRTASVADDLNLFSMTVRQGNYKYWEPFYISDNTEPIFDERVTWEGQSNKRIQGYAMCLLGYEYHVLHPAFLVHSPGIKKPARNSVRAKYAKEMTRFIKTKIEPEYRVLYGKNKNCVT
ncbi:beta-1,4-glucuronyltransferase 1 [Drosophila novamexicana]|uniref:beta-1,4-glucuronyltransferase 1 n=1 Tax=Drosophila novamexicana TaxID=47314 RepID=UPI0011E606F9|nr:beta-1,4-glucuronyltransferase 1 [Drosophila novamexicana]